MQRFPLQWPVGYPRTPTPSNWTEIQRLYKIKIKKTHPDAGGDPEKFHAVQRAYEEAKRYFSNCL